MLLRLRRHLLTHFRALWLGVAWQLLQSLPLKLGDDDDNRVRGARSLHEGMLAGAGRPHRADLAPGSDDGNVGRSRLPGHLPPAGPGMHHHLQRERCDPLHQRRALPHVPRRRPPHPALAHRGPRAVLLRPPPPDPRPRARADAPRAAQRRARRHAPHDAAVPRGASHRRVEPLGGATELEGHAPRGVVGGKLLAAEESRHVDAPG
mmetsp:Transcript_14358/g.41252  ORF Transcript_14358/g.41252 Transcript_14358/m.41252 type:complete len:206 (+) Transcript_14358:318-935(+)